MVQESAVQVIDHSAQALEIPSEVQFRRDMEAITNFQKLVQANLQEGLDYGVIPGTPKPTLLKPGAEKIVKLIKLADTYLILDKLEDWDRPLFRYMIKCQLISMTTGTIVAEGVGECNSMEAKYRWRDRKRVCPKCNGEFIIKGKEQYGGGWVCFKKQGGCGATFQDGDKSIEGQVAGRTENDDVYSVINTILKMAKKRAMIDAALSAGRLSNLFTQDIEDMIHSDVSVVPVAKKSTPAPSKAEKSEPKAIKEKTVITKKMADDLWQKAELMGYSRQEFVDRIASFGVTKLSEFTKEQFSELTAQIESGEGLSSNTEPEEVASNPSYQGETHGRITAA